MAKFSSARRRIGKRWVSCYLSANNLAQFTDRYYKMKIFHTDFQNAERDLLYLPRTFILATLFVVPYPELTTVLQGIATTCPRLLNNVLPKSEQFEFAVVDPG
jgi:hypothetical protein